MTDKITELEKAVEHGAKAFYEAVDAQNLLKKEKVDLEKQISKLKGMR
jgi:sugar-specific transcriptional regulator TrmB